MPKLKDGVEFHIGMTVVFDDGREVNTEGFHLEEETIANSYGENKQITVLQHKESGGIEVGLLYSSQEGRIKWQLARINHYQEGINMLIDEQKDLLLKGEDVSDFVYGGIEVLL